MKSGTARSPLPFNTIGAVRHAETQSPKPGCLAREHADIALRRLTNKYGTLSKSRPDERIFLAPCTLCPDRGFGLKIMSQSLTHTCGFRCQTAVRPAHTTMQARHLPALRRVKHSPATRRCAGSQKAEQEEKQAPSESEVQPSGSLVSDPFPPSPAATTPSQRADTPTLQPPTPTLPHVTTNTSHGALFLHHPHRLSASHHVLIQFANAACARARQSACKNQYVTKIGCRR